LAQVQDAPVRSILVLLIACLLLTAEEPADLGGAAPSLDGVAWKRGSAPAAGTLMAVVVWPPEDGLDQPALRVTPDGVVIVLLATSMAEEVEQLAARPDGPALGVATPQVLERWLGSEEPPLPSAALVGADGMLLWRGRLAGLVSALARERSGGYDRARMRETAGLRAQLRAVLAADPAMGKLPEALLLTARILALEPIDEEALRLRLDVARHLGEREVFRRTLSGLPLAQLPAGLANELAWERATDEDLAWRHPDLALRLVEHAHALEPADAEVEDTYARVLYLLGELDAAVAAQLRAVSLAPDDGAMHDALDYYREVQALHLERQRRLPLP
jgi:hypothetical protein